MGLAHHYVLFGEIVPKARPRSGNNGRHYLPQGYRDWKDSAICSFCEQYSGDPIAVPVSVEVALVGKHARRGDADNILGSILDAMVQAGVLAGDNLIRVPAVSLQLFHSREFPSALIRVAEHRTGSMPAWCDQI